MCGEKKAITSNLLEIAHSTIGKKMNKNLRHHIKTISKWPINK